ncbi:MAG TPA: MFS transporter [Phycisphaerales bacterium]|nr:MFS transporter [Phycisphaerales bacterium]
MSYRLNGDGGRVEGAWPLYGAAVGMAMNLSVLWTAMPFIIRNMGGTEVHVGYAWAANMLGYLACLAVSPRLLGHLKPRTMTRIASAVMLAATAAMVFVARAGLSDDSPPSTAAIWGLIAAGAVSGAAMSLYWPFLMAWVSADFEGPGLNRRLGTYNGMWSGAAIVGPFIGGALVEANTLLPIAAAVGCLTVCLLLLCIAHDASALAPAHESSRPAETMLPDPAILIRLRWMARIALFCAWAALGVARSQFPLLFVGMGYSETQFGIMLTAFGICNFLTLTGAGRVAFWHFRPALLMTTQTVLVLPMVMMIYGADLWIFAAAFLIMGCGFGFAYSSHLYYGVCGSKKRSTPMIVHEATLSLGVVVGAGVGGYVSGRFGVYWPYGFAIAVLAIGLATQFILWLLGRAPMRP